MENRHLDVFVDFMRKRGVRGLQELDEAGGDGVKNALIHSFEKFDLI